MYLQYAVIGNSGRCLFFYDLFSKQAKIYTDGCESIQDRREDVFLWLWRISGILVARRTESFICTHTLHRRLTFLWGSACASEDVWSQTRSAWTGLRLHSSQGEFHLWSSEVTALSQTLPRRQKNNTLKQICQQKETLWPYCLNCLFYDVHSKSWSMQQTSVLAHHTLGTNCFP